MDKTFAPHVVINDQFRLLRPLGSGGMGSIWEAEHLQLGGRVAIKFLSHVHLSNPWLRERFLREARAISCVRSPHVVQILGHGTSRGVPYVVLELLEGEDLGAYLHRVGRLDLAETVLLLDQVCLGLSRVHECGIVHRDVKPENLFLTDQGDGRHFVKVLDFGIAHEELGAVRPAQPKVSGFLGSLQYMSPEQLVDPAAVDGRTDVWALGVVMYQMLTGVLPFDGGNTPHTCTRICQADFMPVQVRNPDVPAAVGEWIERCLQIDRDVRYATIEDAHAALLLMAREELGTDRLTPFAATYASGRPASARFSTSPPIQSDRPASDPSRLSRLRSGWYRTKRARRGSKLVVGLLALALIMGVGLVGSLAVR